MVADVRSEDRWPSFVEAARREKVLSLLALRMHLEGQASAGMIFYSSRLPTSPTRCGYFFGP